MPGRIKGTTFLCQIRGEPVPSSIAFTGAPTKMVTPTTDRPAHSQLASADEVSTGDIAESPPNDDAFTMPRSQELQGPGLSAEDHSRCVPWQQPPQLMNSALFIGVQNTRAESSLNLGVEKVTAQSQGYAECCDPSAARDWLNCFGADEVDACEDAVLDISDYTATCNYKNYNTTLRTGENPAPAMFRDSVRRQIAHITKIIDAVALPRAVVLHRGISADAARQLAPEGFVVGQTIEDKGFMSTSLLASVAKEFAGDGGTHFKIEAPAGAKGIYLNYFDIPDDQNLEWEVLLQRGCTMRVKDVKTVEGEGRKYEEVRVELVPAETLDPIPE